MALLCTYDLWVISKEVDMNKSPPIRPSSFRITVYVSSVTTHEEEQ